MLMEKQSNGAAKKFANRGNGDLANIGKVAVVIGFFIVIWGLIQLGFANTGICAGTINGGGCTTDYQPLILPSIIGVGFTVAGSWLFWVFKPQRVESQ